MDDISIAIIRKSDSEEIRITVKEFKGNRFVDVRVFTDYTTGERGPTKRGITAGPSRLPELIAALQQAQARIEELAVEAA